MENVDKIIPFLGGGGFSGAVLLLAWFLLQRQERTRDATSQRIDHFGDEMYDRWKGCETILTRFRYAYAALYYACPADIRHEHPSPQSIEDGQKQKPLEQ